MATSVPIVSIVIDAGTQVRERINEDIVTEYSERMNDGATFPPVVLFHDGSAYYLADGFHRTLAAQRNGLAEIKSEVRAGTKQDALWFALGANRENGQRMTRGDVRHAVLLALQTWGNNKTLTAIAKQIGVPLTTAHTWQSQFFQTEELKPRDRVTGKDGKSYPATRQTRTAEPEPPQQADEPMNPRTKAGREQRRSRMREMAEDGYTSHQIAAELGISPEGCRAALRREDIEVHADRVVGRPTLHKADRIVGQMVMDAENLTADVALINFAELSPAALPEWIASLKQSYQALKSFIHRLSEEQKKHEQAA